MPLINRTKQKQYLVIGLGRFGSSIAKSLAQQGAEVLAIDQNEALVDAITPYVTQAMQADATDEEVLSSVDVGSYDAAIIAMGSNIRDSILIAIQCKEAGIPLVLAKATDDLHAKVLKKVGVDQILFPERVMGQRLATMLLNPGMLDIMNLPDGYELTEISTPASWTGKTLAQLNIRKTHGVSVLAIRRDNRFQVSPAADDQILSGDQLLLLGKSSDISRLQNR